MSSNVAPQSLQGARAAVSRLSRCQSEQKVSLSVGTFTERRDAERGDATETTPEQRENKRRETWTPMAILSGVLDAISIPLNGEVVGVTTAKTKGGNVCVEIQRPESRYGSVPAENADAVVALAAALSAVENGVEDADAIQRAALDAIGVSVEDFNALLAEQQQD